GQQGTLTLEANNLLVDGGKVIADAAAHSNPPAIPASQLASGTSGGGHGGVGGDGTQPSGGHAYADVSNAAHTLTGSVGAGAGGGAGGGAITIIGDQQVVVNGMLSADGAPGGGDAAAGVCIP